VKTAGFDPVPMGVFDHPPPAGSEIKSVELSDLPPATQEALRTTRYYYRLTRAIGDLIHGLI
jgi:hypothetical protein